MAYQFCDLRVVILAPHDLWDAPKHTSSLSFGEDLSIDVPYHFCKRKQTEPEPTFRIMFHTCFKSSSRLFFLGALQGHWLIAYSSEHLGGICWASSSIYHSSKQNENCSSIKQFQRSFQKPLRKLKSNLFHFSPLGRTSSSVSRSRCEAQLKAKPLLWTARRTNSSSFENFIAMFCQTLHNTMRMTIITHHQKLSQIITHHHKSSQHFLISSSHHISLSCNLLTFSLDWAVAVGLKNFEQVTSCSAGSACSSTWGIGVGKEHDHWCGCTCQAPVCRASWIKSRSCRTEEDAWAMASQLCLI